MPSPLWFGFWLGVGAGALALGAIVLQAVLAAGEPEGGFWALPVEYVVRRYLAELWPLAAIAAASVWAVTVVVEVAARVTLWAVSL